MNDKAARGGDATLVRGSLLTDHAPASVPVCPPQQLAGQSYGQLSFRSRGDGETIVFLHGLLGSSKSWAFQFEHFSRNYGMIAWDAPGFGQSDLVPASIN